MADLLLRGISPDELKREIVAAVLKALDDREAAEAEPLLVDRVKAAQLLGIGVSTLDQLVADEALPSVAIGRRRLFDVSDCVEALKNRTH